MKLNLLWLIFTVGLALIRPSISAELCHKQDKAILLKIKKAFKNPYVLASWDPKTDCCEWYLVSCDEVTHRITSVGIHSEGLSGKIPAELAQVPYLDTLILTRQPKLVGPIPAAIGTIKRLKTLTISGTSISGPIPEFISGLKGLTSLDLSGNKFSGHIPASLATLPLLSGLRLDKNELSGPIPSSFAYFKVKKAMYMYLAHNKLSGPIPASFVGSDFVVFDASHNLLTGDASAMFGEGKIADTVDLSRNNLSFDLSKVKFSGKLGTLDLSHNMITGSIPASLTHSRGLHGLDLSFNLLCGRIPTGGILQGFKAASFLHNKCLCGSPLPIPCKKK